MVAGESHAGPPTEWPQDGLVKYQEHMHYSNVDPTAALTAWNQVVASFTEADVQEHVSRKQAISKQDTRIPEWRCDRCWSRNWLWAIQRRMCCVWARLYARWLY